MRYIVMVSLFGAMISGVIGKNPKPFAAVALVIVMATVVYDALRKEEKEEA